MIAAAYGALVLLGNAIVLGAVVAAKLSGADPRVRDATLPPITNLRIVDGRLWAGAQTGRGQYRQLAAMGVTVVVDLRTGRRDDPRDDAAFLEEIGMEYVWLPLRDGQAPDAAMVGRFLEVMGNARGIVYMHCGGGVGRSFALQSAYEAARGRDPSLVELLSVGPPTIEQAWYVFSAGRGRPGSSNTLVEALSRYVIDAPRTIFNWLFPDIV